MGNFDNEQSISKKYARIGQNFSTTKHAILMDEDKVKVISDIYTSES